MTGAASLCALDVRHCGRMLAPSHSGASTWHLTTYALHDCTDQAGGGIQRADGQASHGAAKMTNHTSISVSNA